MQILLEGWVVRELVWAHRQEEENRSGDRADKKPVFRRNKCIIGAGGVFCKPVYVDFLASERESSTCSRSE